MKFALALTALVFSISALASDPAAVSCETKSRELYHALKTAGRIMATPQEDWTSRDVDMVYDTLNKYKKGFTTEKMKGRE